MTVMNGANQETLEFSVLEKWTRIDVGGTRYFKDVKIRVTSSTCAAVLLQEYDSLRAVFNTICTSLGLNVVSQFTLYADVRKGRRPSFVDALRPGEAEPLYDYFNELIEARFGPISKGIFGADMKVKSINDGPFTLIIDSKDLF